MTAREAIAITYPQAAKIWPIIEVPFCDAIPIDYPGPMGVPQSYMDKHDPDRFIILDHIKPKCHGKDTYERIVIANKRFCSGRFQIYKKPNGTYCTAELGEPLPYEEGGKK